MTEDFVGTSGKLEEEFVYAPNNNLRTEVFVRFEQRAAQEKPLLLPGLMALKEKMGTYDFDKYINSLENVNVSGKSMIMLTGDEKTRTILVSRWLPKIRDAFGVDSVRIVGGGRGGIDAY